MFHISNQHSTIMDYVYIIIQIYSSWAHQCSYWAFYYPKLTINITWFHYFLFWLYFSNKRMNYLWVLQFVPCWFYQLHYWHCITVGLSHIHFLYLFPVVHIYCQPCLHVDWVFVYIYIYLLIQICSYFSRLNRDLVRCKHPSLLILHSSM